MEEEALRRGLEEELERIIEESNEGLDCMDNEDVVTSIISSHSQIFDNKQIVVTFQSVIGWKVTKVIGLQLTIYVQ